jgi:purine-nucleoside phosphorylase
MDNFKFGDNQITNLEMETAAIYGLSRLLGHNALSLNAIITTVLELLAKTPIKRSIN